jgi:O-antigen/teichoic acid export membrane protein
MPGDVPQELSLRRVVRRGLGWKTLTQLVAQALRVPVAIVVARELTPRELGVATMALVIGGIASLTSGFGADIALVQSAEASEEDRSTAFWAVLGAGVACTLGGAAMAPLAGDWCHDGGVTPLFAVASLAFVLTSLGAVPRALLLRDLRFGALEAGTIAAAAVGSAVLVGGAVGGLGAWSLVLQQLAGLTVLAAAPWWQSRWRPRAGFSRTRLAALAPLSTDVLATRVSLGAARLVDNVLVGRFLGAATLGLYSLAYNVMLLPATRVTGPAQDVLYPVLARLGNERTRLASIWTRSTEAMVLVVVPAGILVLAVADELVRLLFGEPWLPAVPLVRALVAAGVLQALSTGNMRVLVAVGRSRSASRFAALWLTAVVAAVAVGVHWGILWVCVAYTCVTAVFTPILFWLVGAALDLTPRELLQPFRAVVAPSAAMGAALALVRLGTGRGSEAAAAQVAVGVSAYAAVYLVEFRGRRGNRLALGSHDPT